MLRLITTPLSTWDEALPEVAVRVDRLTLAKRIWRGTADDGSEFGFDLTRPLKPGDPVFQTPAERYVVQQEPEPLLEVSLDITPSAAAGIGWVVGNLHLELSAEATRLLAPDQPAVRQLFARLDIAYRAVSGVFRPGRFVRGQQAVHDLGPSHQH